MKLSKPLTLLFPLVLFCLNVFGQTVIKGTVKDNKNNPIAGASIAIKDSYDGATSDSSGKFSFKSFEKGDQIVIVTYVGYKTYEQQVKMEASPVMAGFSWLKTGISMVALALAFFD